MNINLILDLFKYIQNLFKLIQNYSKLFKIINHRPRQNYLWPKKLNGDEWKTFSYDGRNY